MTILYHHRTLADGAEGIHIEAMVNAFRQQGHTVAVIGLAANRPSDGRHLVQRVRARLPKGIFELASIAVNGPEYLQAVAVLRRLKPQLVYVRHAKHAVAMLAAARHRRIATVLEVNSIFSAPAYERFEPLALRAIAEHAERWAFRAADVVVAVSSPLASAIRAMSGAHVIVVPNGVDTVRFDPHRTNARRVRQALGLDDRLTIGWSGILRDWHGLDLLLRALTSLDGVTLLIVGDGPARANVQRLAVDLGIEHRVVVTGRVAHHDMPDHIAAMDIAVIADERTGVASPMKMMEYMAVGRAVVAPRLDNIQDVLRDGVNGLLFQAGNAQDLAAVIRRLTHDPSLRAQLAARARADVEQHRSWRHVADTVISSLRREHLYPLAQ